MVHITYGRSGKNRYRIRAWRDNPKDPWGVGITISEQSGLTKAEQYAKDYGGTFDRAEFDAYFR